MKIWVRALRLHQWNKQALIFLPLISLGDTVRISDLLNLLYIALAFSLIASSIYLFNDLQDLVSDRLDPIKSQRPLANGSISVRNVKIFGMILLLTGLLIVFINTTSTNHYQLISLFSFYLILNFLYSNFHLKKYRVIGLLIVAVGFAIRFSIGTFTLNLKFSIWAFVLIIQLAMFMLSGKRFQNIVSSTVSDDRESGQQFWLLSMVTFAAFFAATYAGFITDPEVVKIWGKEALIISILPIGIGLVRFVELVTYPEKFSISAVTENMTKDPFLLLLVFAFAFILLLGRISA